MCYINGIKVSRAEYLDWKKSQVLIQEFYKPVQNGFEFTDWPILKLDTKSNQVICQNSHWEFIPYWIKNTEELTASRKKITTLNARGETVFESKMFQKAATNSRCIVLSSGFYEFRHVILNDDKKPTAIPYFITLCDQSKPFFYMAGVCQQWVDKTTGETIDTFAILTTEANDLMQAIHNQKKRMPTILNQEQAEKWLEQTTTLQELQKLAVHKIDSDSLMVTEVKKSFRTDPNPEQPFEYDGLPPLDVAI